MSKQSKESHSRGNIKYRQRHIKQYPFCINKDKRPEIVEWLAAKDNVNGYLTSLVVADMAANGVEAPSPAEKEKPDSK